MQILKSYYLGLCSICLLLCLLISGTDHIVKAEDATATPEPPTPTATYQSLMDLQGTPVPEDYSCSDYILGLGVKTPSSRWMMYCSNCLRDVEYSLTATAKPTQPEQTKTPTATYYPGETRTPTPPPTQPPQEPTLYASEIFEYVYTKTEGQTYTYFDLPIDQASTFKRFLFVKTYPNSNHAEGTNIYIGNTNFWKLLTKAGEDAVYIDHWNNDPLPDDFYLPVANNFLSSTGTIATTIRYVGYDSLPISQIKIYDPDGLTGETAVLHYQIIYYGIPPYQPTPTPQPTATYVPGGYCSEIEEEGEEEELFNMPNFLVGEATCHTFQGHTIDFSSVNWLPGVNIPTVEMPGIEICIMGIYFGNLDILGYEINLDTLAGIVGSIAILRWFMRS